MESWPQNSLTRKTGDVETAIPSLKADSTMRTLDEVIFRTFDAWLLYYIGHRFMIPRRAFKQKPVSPESAESALSMRIGRARRWPGCFLVSPRATIVITITPANMAAADSDA